MIINSILDTDLYKFTMMQVAYHLFPSTEVEYKLICRNKAIDLRVYRKQIEAEIDHLCSLKLTQDELAYLKTIRFLKADFINFLEDFTLKKKFIYLGEENEQLSIRIKGDWAATILFEVPILAIISEIYCRSQIDYALAHKQGLINLERKVEFINHHGFRFMEFGTRRRYSSEWQATVVNYLAKNLAIDVFAGTSNLMLAKQFNLRAQGTTAHEYLQVGQGLGTVQLAKSQKYMLEKWAEEYRGDLGIALTDTINMDAFLRDFDLYLAKLYDGCRHDSGDPIIWGEKLIRHYQHLGIDPATKIAIFSDNLSFEKADFIAKHFRGRLKVSFGIGTNLTNDVGVKPLSIVIKLVTVNGNPVAKISDTPSKESCEDLEFLSYLKKVYGLTAN